MINRYFKVIIIIIVILSSLSTESLAISQTIPPKTSTNSIYSSTPVFRDDFNGYLLDPDVWQGYENGGVIDVYDGWVTLSKPGVSNTFPYVHTKYNFIPQSGNFSIKIGVQYLSVTPNGDGFSVDDRLPGNGSPGSWSWQPTVYTLWQDSILGYALFDYTGSTRYNAVAPHLLYHDIEIKWLENTDEYYIDGNLVNTVSRDSGVPRPVSLWFGNPVIAYGSLEWTSFKIDYIEVDSLSGPTPFFNLPINYPGRENPTPSQFITAWDRCITSIFDHRLPGNKGLNGDKILVNFIGEEIPAALCNFNDKCYDGHEGIDFDDYGRCYGDTSVYPVATGDIVTAETGWFNDGYGNRVMIQHGNTGYKTLYGHLSEILVHSGPVDETTKIGIIGNTGCNTPEPPDKPCGTHLHLSVYYDGKYVDPSGWEPMPWKTDPYEELGNGPASYRLWLFSPRKSTPVNNSQGTTISSTSGNTIVSIPPYAYDDDYQIALTELAPLSLPVNLQNGGHGFYLNGQNLSGEPISSLDKDISITINFTSDDIKGLNPDTISLFNWNDTKNQWIALPTIVVLPSLGHATTHSLGSATAIVRDLGNIALLGEPYTVNLPIIVR